MSTIFTFKLGKEQFKTLSEQLLCTCPSHNGKIASNIEKLPVYPPLHTGCTCFIEEETVKVGEPFAGYTDFDDCVSKNGDKEDPQAYCATIMRKSESESLKTRITENKADLTRLDELGLVAFDMDAKLAVPTVSGNNRKWTEKTLKGAIPHYIGKPVMLDHTQNVGDVVAVTTDCYWGPSRTRENDKTDALRAHSIGLMDKTLFEKLRTDGKNVIGVPLVKGLSMGGSADLEYDENNAEIPVNFIPEEYSITPFPGIKEAEIERMVPIMESLRTNRKEKVKQKIIESQLPEFIPVFLLPLRGEACPEGYILDPAGKTCEIPQQMKTLSGEVQEHLRKGAPGYTLISDVKEKPLIYVKDEWLQKAVEAVGETGRPPQDWWDRCIDGVTKSGSADDPEAVCGNTWFNVLGEWAKRKTGKATIENKVELRLPKETEDMFKQLADNLKQPEVKIPDNSFTQTAKEAMTREEQESFEAMILDIERQKRGLPSLQEQPAEESLKPLKEEREHKKIVEQLTAERDELKGEVGRIEALRKERDELQQKLEHERTLYKALVQGQRIPASNGKGKAFTQSSVNVEVGTIENSDDAGDAYKRLLEQGLSRRDATRAVLQQIMEQEGMG